MLKNLPSLLTPDALHALASMGHGDDVAIVDANFPAARLAAQGGARLVELAGVDAPAALQAVLQLLPVDTFLADPVRVMEVVGDPAAVPLPVLQFKLLLAEAGEAAPTGLVRETFYAQASAAFVILRTGERRTYGNILLRKGVVSGAVT
ncbi:L-fucose mutarotase [Polaromonas sp. OV174]|uniref:RbsD/FucU family protein n=1 Tax=Polaromonas sp. OV174 TaxID=1855300 RepID=UPI0008EDB869|nr:RbsD/FucU domain-containing protein [Polaromonas sp. OV174]SFB72919.1 L-fucose mutarotase [Polaromonas sp. OV174]